MATIIVGVFGYVFRRDEAGRFPVIPFVSELLFSPFKGLQVAFVGRPEESDLPGLDLSLLRATGISPDITANRFLSQAKMCTSFRAA
jgi:hypothetical protein